MSEMWIWIALFGVLAALALSIASFFKNHTNAININNLELLYQEVSRKLEVLDDSAKGLGAHMNELRSELKAVEQHQPVEPVDSTEEAILKASGMLASGAAHQQVADECGLPVGEIRLMDAMRRSKQVNLEPEEVS